MTNQRFQLFVSSTLSTLCQFDALNSLSVRRFQLFVSSTLSTLCFEFESFLNLLPDDKFLDSSKLREFADDNFKFDENGKTLSKRVEKNTVGKGEIARYEQFLLFPQCFQQACFPGASKGVIEWEWVLIGSSVFWQTSWKNNTNKCWYRNLKSAPSLQSVPYLPCSSRRMASTSHLTIVRG